MTCWIISVAFLCPFLVPERYALCRCINKMRWFSSYVNMLTYPVCSFSPVLVPTYEPSFYNTAVLVLNSQMKQVSNWIHVTHSNVAILISSWTFNFCYLAGSFGCIFSGIAGIALMQSCCQAAKSVVYKTVALPLP